MTGLLHSPELPAPLQGKRRAGGPLRGGEKREEEIQALEPAQSQLSTQGWGNAWPCPGGDEALCQLSCRRGGGLQKGAVPASSSPFLVGLRTREDARRLQVSPAGPASCRRAGVPNPRAGHSYPIPTILSLPDFRGVFVNSLRAIGPSS